MKDKETEEEKVEDIIEMKIMIEDNHKKDTDKTNLKKLKMMNTKEEKERPEEINKDLKAKAELLNTNIRKNI